MINFGQKLVPAAVDDIMSLLGEVVRCGQGTVTDACDSPSRAVQHPCQAMVHPERVMASVGGRKLTARCVGVT